MFTGGSNDNLGLAGGAAAAAADEDGAYRYCDDGDDEILERAFIDVILRPIGCCCAFTFCPHSGRAPLGTCFLDSGRFQNSIQIPLLKLYYTVHFLSKFWEDSF